MKNVYVMRMYRENKGHAQEVAPPLCLVRDHLTKKELRLGIAAAFRCAAEGCENNHMIVRVYKNDLDWIYFKALYRPTLVCIIRSDTRVDGSTIDAYVSLEKPGSEPQQIRCMNIAS